MCSENPGWAGGQQDFQELGLLDFAPKSNSRQQCGFTVKIFQVWQPPFKCLLPSQRSLLKS